jgi:hypothetical protein
LLAVTVLVVQIGSNTRRTGPVSMAATATGKEAMTE